MPERQKNPVRTEPTRFLVIIETGVNGENPIPVIDIRQYPELLHTINAIINNKGVAEVKGEDWKDGKKILVVEQNRTVRIVSKI